MFQLIAHSQTNQGQNQQLTIFALIIAIAAIFAPIIYQVWTKYQEKEALKGALLQEMLSNMDGLFNGGIERPFLFKVFEVFIEKLGNKVKDDSEFQKIISLYIDLKDYRAVTSRFWPPKNNKDTVAHLQSTQKQIQTINKYLQYFNEEKVTDEYDMQVLEKSREKAQEVRNNSQQKWHARLKENINKVL